MFNGLYGSYRQLSSVEVDLESAILIIFAVKKHRVTVL